jgi:hypothetical protein
MPKRNPWDRLKPEAIGSQTRDAIYTAVGMALDQWEALQEHLELLFGALVESDSYALRRAFGTLESVPNKVAMMREAAIMSLTNNQVLLEKTCSLLTEINEFSQRRNDIAHGQVDMYRRTPRGWFLTPRFHYTKKYKPGSPEPMAYRWMSDQINQYTVEFQRLRAEARDLTVRIRAVLQQEKPS